MQDSELVERLRRGEEPAFRAFYERFSTRTYNVVLSYLHDTAEAEEVTQDVFVKAFEAIGSFAGQSSVSTWLYRIAINKSLDALKARRRQKRFAGLVSLFTGESLTPRHDVADFHHPGVVLEQQERASLLFKALDGLPDKQRTAFVLAKVEGLPQAEIAAVLGVSVGAVESLLHRGKATLRQLLGSYYDQGGR